MLKTLSADQQNSFKCQHLLSQVNYKLSEYNKAMETYVNILAESQRGEGEKLEADEVSDIIVNYLACQSCTSDECLAQIQKVIDQNKGFDETYEYFFNLSQVYLKEGHIQQSIDLLEQAYEKAVKDDAFRDDQVRFKVQEMHFLNELYSQFSSIEYASKHNQTWFDFSKSIRNNILVELNINALSDIFSLNTSTFKEVIGSLNWKKFAERIKT
jgi:tetratricopeptide (TPR) repeat protein